MRALCQHYKGRGVSGFYDGFLNNFQQITFLVSLIFLMGGTAGGAGSMMGTLHLGGPQK